MYTATKIKVQPTNFIIFLYFFGSLAITIKKMPIAPAQIIITR